MSKKTGNYIPCHYCGKLIYRTKSRLIKHEHHYCSNHCQRMQIHQDTFEDRECEICGRLFHVSKKSSQRFCSVRCQSIWQTQQTGPLHPKYTKQSIVCEQCGRTFPESPYKLKGTSHHFCSIKCRREWYATVWSQTDEWKNISRQRAVNTLCSKPSATRTKPQQLVNDLLDELGIQYSNEEPFEYYAVDNYITESNLIIEVMGDFWHCNPQKYKSVEYDIQQRRVIKDKAKHTYFKQYYDIDILYIWEKDITYRPEVCKQLIKQYINKQGQLVNYHSFNYEIEDGQLMLNDVLIMPYQEKIHQPDSITKTAG